MADIKDFWDEAIRFGVEALDFRLIRLGTSPPLMVAELNRCDLPGPVLHAAQAAMALDLEIAARVQPVTPIVMARKLLAHKIEVAPCRRRELLGYRRLLGLELQKLVNPNPAMGLARLVT